MSYIVAQICKPEGELNHDMYITSPHFQIISSCSTLEEAREFKKNLATQGIPEEWFIIFQAYQ